MVDPWSTPHWDITIPAGADFDDFLTWVPDGVTAADLSGYTAKMEFRRRYDDPTALITLTDTDGITLGAEGVITIAIPAAKTAILGDVKKVVVVTSMELTSPGGKVYRLFDGAWTVTPEATK